MRSSVFVYTTALITMLVVCIISVITMKSSYMEKVDSSVDDAIVYSVKMLQVDRDLSGSQDVTIISNFENSLNYEDELSEFKQKFVNSLTKIIDEDITDLDIDIYGADEVRGILSIKVTAHFKYPFGGVDTVSTYKTVILDKYLKQDKIGL